MDKKMLGNTLAGLNVDISTWWCKKHFPTYSLCRVLHRSFLIFLL